MNDTEIVELINASKSGRYDAENDAQVLCDIVDLLALEGRFD